ncbi:MAG: hypothetical protein K2M31_03385 [Muribaculaceae bacterium]|nr:hypothetical protein [Muribaculaceae bacterium]
MRFTTILLRDDSDDKEVTMIKSALSKSDKITETIEYSINTYLQKNKGAVSDFNLIKDIVERNCDTLESEISSQTPLPLYLGLMGTVLGIIIGLVTIAISGGFSNIQNVIETLMADVAIAMAASFAGILFTTWTLWKSKECKVVVENNKNIFYTWIQTNLLPVLSQSAVSAITLLQQNLTHFNDSFTGTIERLEARLSNVGDVYESQIEILDKIEAIDVKKMAIANVKVLGALDRSMGSLERFSQYMSDVTDYITAVKDLNDKIDDHLERTHALETISEFYQTQMHEIELRQEGIRAAVVAVDDVMKSALATMQANGEESMKVMQESFSSQIESIQSIVALLTERLTAQINQMPEIVKKLNTISEIPTKLDKLIHRIEKSNSQITKELSRNSKPIEGISNFENYQNVSGYSSSKSENTGIKWGILISLIVIALIGITNLSYDITSKTYESPSRVDESQSLNEITNSEDNLVATKTDTIAVDSITNEHSINSNPNSPTKKNLPHRP